MDWHSETRDQALVATPKGTINHETADAFEEHLIRPWMMPCNEGRTGDQSGTMSTIFPAPDCAF